MRNRSWPLEFGVAVLATLAAMLLRLALIPLIGETAMPFIIFFLAVLFASWYGGFRAGVLCVVLSTATAAYVFIPPVRSFWISNPVDRIALLIFLMVGLGVALLSRSQGRALESAAQEAWLRRRAEREERSQRQRLETTLASIGDGVIATEAEGQVSFMNAVAEMLTGWRREEALGKPIEMVFRIVDEATRKPAEFPTCRAMEQGGFVNLSDGTILVAKDGKEIPVDDSASVIRDPEGKTAGAVLIFRDITESRRIDREREASTRTARQLAA